MKTLGQDLAVLQLSQIIEQLNEIADCALINIYNDYAYTNKYERISDNDEHTINDLYSSPYDALLAASYGDYNPNHDYFTFDGYSNLSSFNYADDENSPIGIEELAQWIVDNELYNDYDLSVTTLDDMYNCILDNLEDADSLDHIASIAECLGLSIDYFDSNNESPADFENSIINDITNHIHNDFELLSITLEYMNLEV